MRFLEAAFEAVGLVPEVMCVAGGTQPVALLEIGREAPRVLAGRAALVAVVPVAEVVRAAELQRVCVYVCVCTCVCARVRVPIGAHQGILNGGVQ